MSKLTFSKAAGKRSKVELVVDRRVVDQAYIDAENPIAFFSAEYMDLEDKNDEGGSVESKILGKKRESNLRRAESYLCEFFKLLAEINETDPEAVDELLEILTEAVEASTAGDSSE